MGHWPHAPLLSGVLLGVPAAPGPPGEERLAGSIANFLPRYRRCRARLFLTEHSLPGSKRLHPTPLCRCDGELTAAPQACPAHLIIHSSTALPPNPVLGNKKGGLPFLGNRATFCVLLSSVLSSTSQPLVPGTLALPGTSHHVSPVECILPEWRRPELQRCLCHYPVCLPHQLHVRVPVRGWRWRLWQGQPRGCLRSRWLRQPEPLQPGGLQEDLHQH